MAARDDFLSALDRNRESGTGVAVSVCSAHRDVLRALFRTARQRDQFALIESTSNQVDQYGGYTGMKPADFAAMVYSIADSEGFPSQRILLGGDHLGPNRWQKGPAETAMSEAETLMAAYVAAGYEKIHLDASFVCADDTAPLGDEIVAARCVRLAKVCEAHAGRVPPVYVIGTEVPTPGGAVEEEEMRPTSPEEAERTLQVFESTFLDAGLADAWSRVVGLVVQPGVEFSDDEIADYPGDQGLKDVILRHRGMGFEAHSTDYQTPANLRRLVENHFFFLKVGPWLTFALRESLMALEAIERELNPAEPSHFRAVLDAVMCAEPGYWQNYYAGSAAEMAYKRVYSYSDRARYYLGHPKVASAYGKLLENLGGGVPEALVSQYLPECFETVRGGGGNRPQDLILGRVSKVIGVYYDAGGSMAD
ncbi:MAG: class II D-tagatose-bisphosphate aldolase, non-catalytic subunit [Alphaproteobacteria bacterium]|nr:class II D-tagatose-bisphosphate aldolase, non-catalytic subunit [Alphaproteobacteria bacterium]